MKLEEITEFAIEWSEDQRLTIFEGLAMATKVLDAGPLPGRVLTRQTSYMALGTDVPPRWLELFQHALIPSAFEAEVTYTSRAEHGFLTQTLSLSPCEQGEHLHASVMLVHTMMIEPDATPAAVKNALVAVWRDLGDRMAELQDEWVHPFLEQALDLETLHGGPG